jgi:TfoX/Sxy family transcriptional regulator of competence genes
MPKMPSFEKSPSELVARFDAAAARHPQAQRRKMFGYPALFVGGNLATSLYEDRWVVRLFPDDLADLMGLPGASSFSPMPGRSMSGWATLPGDVVADEPTLDRWLERALAFAGSLPPKD